MKPGRLTNTGGVYGLPATELPAYPRDVTIDDGRILPRTVFDTWSDENLEAVGLCRIPDPAPPEPTADEIRALLMDSVTAQRDRRRYPHTIDTGLGWPVDMRNATDEANIAGKVTLALAIKAAGSSETINFRGADDQIRVLSADDMITVGRACAALVSSVYAASWAIKAQIEDGTITTSAEIETATDWPD